MKRVTLLLILCLFLVSSSFAGLDIKLSGAMKMGPIDSTTTSWTPTSATTSGGVTASHWYSPSHANFQDSARTTAVTADGDVTGSGTDNMVAADHLSQGTTANKPIYKTGILGGKPMWLFDGTDSVKGPFTTGGAVAQPLTVFIVLKLGAGLSNNNTDYVAFSGDDGTNDALLEKYGTVPIPDAWSIYAGTAVTAGTADTNGNVFSVVFNGASSEFWCNGTSVAAGDAGTRILDGLIIGSYQSGVPGWVGYIADVLIYPGALSTADLNQVGQYLATFYGLIWTNI